MTADLGPTWLDDLAALLADAGLGTWDPEQDYGDDAQWPIFLEHTPPEPGLLVVLTGYAGAEVPAGLDDEPRVQVKVRGTTDPRTSRSHATAIYRHLHELALAGGMQLGETRWLTSAYGVNGGAIPLGIDANHRHIHVTNHRLTIGETR